MFWLNTKIIFSYLYICMFLFLILKVISDIFVLLSSKKWLKNEHFHNFLMCEFPKWSDTIKFSDFFLKTSYRPSKNHAIIRFSWLPFSAFFFFHFSRIVFPFFLPSIFHYCARFTPQRTLILKIHSLNCFLSSQSSFVISSLWSSFLICFTYPPFAFHIKYFFKTLIILMGSIRIICPWNFSHICLILISKPCFDFINIY